MESNYFHLLSCIFLILNPFPVLLTLSSDSDAIMKASSPPLDFLKNLIGTRKGNSAKGISQLKKYLSKLGYIDTSHDQNDFFDDALELAIINYQSYFKLTVTNGVLDAKTVEQMMRPRCGVPDSINFRSDVKIPITASHYTFFPGSPKWPPTKRNLTYSFPPGDGERTDLNTSIFDALNMWAIVSPFRFTYVPDYDQADIKISFQYRDHGDGRNPFDGPGGFLAHAFQPIDGRLHYDGDERWVDGVIQGAFDLRTVGLHELGHVLGLGHTTNDASIMYPYIENGLRKGLDQEDIKGIRSLYLYPS